MNLLSAWKWSSRSTHFHVLTTSAISQEWDGHYPVRKNVLDSGPSRWIRLTNNNDGCARIKKLVDP